MTDESAVRAIVLLPVFAEYYFNSPHECNMHKDFGWPMNIENSPRDHALVAKFKDPELLEVAQDFVNRCRASSQLVAPSPEEAFTSLCDIYFGFESLLACTHSMWVMDDRSRPDPADAEALGLEGRAVMESKAAIWELPEAPIVECASRTMTPREVVSEYLTRMKSGWFNSLVFPDLDPNQKQAYFDDEVPFSDE